MPEVKYSILVVDDEPAQRQLLAGSLGRDYTVVTAANAAEATQLMSRRNFDLLLTDERMPGMSGIELIRWSKEHSPETPVVVLTAYGSIETAVEAMKLGAEEYLTKPLKSPEELRLVVAKALRERGLRDRSLLLEAESQAWFPPDVVAGSEAMRKALQLAAQVAKQPTTVLLTGESGTGKEVVARFVHRSSPRAAEAFVAVNCAALSETLLEPELFGHEKGAFTGAVQARRGRFELAHGGTLFLDEIAEMSFNLQAKLLRVLQERQFERVGGTRSIVVDVRVIAATNRDLEGAMQDRTFREDLYYRLNVFPIHLPPLRERRDDILPLAEFFIRKLSARMGRPPAALSVEAQGRLLRHEWPGNVRELQNAIERALIVTGGSVVEGEALPLKAAAPGEGPGGLRTLADLEKGAILEALERNRGERRKTADELGISLRTLQYRLKEYGLAGGQE
jgi:two-component system, NtrC family, response regulator AtoC